MLALPYRSFLLLLIAAVVSSVTAQNDTIHYGGPEGEDEFDLLVETSNDIVDPSSANLDLMWDVNDSLFLIPGYDLYCHWNTQTIFNRAGTHPFMEDSMTLYLSSSEYDHALPCHGPVTSGYGPRKGRMHRGVDLDLETGDPVVNAFSGMVRISKYSKSFGNVVVIRHYNGLETVYAHLSERKVATGQLLQAGDTLGLGGNTGRSFGSHLHFEVRFLDQPIDPALVFDLSQGTLKAGTFDVTRSLMCSGTSASNSTSASVARSTTAARKYHTVRSGDTLSKISRRYGTSVGALCKLNGISQSKTLRLGQKIRCN